MKLFTLVLAGVAGSMCVLGAAPALTPDGDRSVQITDLGYNPDRIEIKEGQKLVWKNMTLKDHNVTSSPPTEGREAQDQDCFHFDSGVIKACGSFSYTFTKAGTYDYHCAFNKNMKGTVIVMPATP